MENIFNKIQQITSDIFYMDDVFDEVKGIQTPILLNMSMNNNKSCAVIDEYYNKEKICRNKDEAMFFINEMKSHYPPDFTPHCCQIRITLKLLFTLFINDNHPNIIFKAEDFK